jgi:hypothetical protein
MVKQVNNKNNKKGVEFDYVEERCQCCGKIMTNVKYIWVGLNDDRYYCRTCVSEYNISAVKCRELD